MGCTTSNEEKPAVLSLEQATSNSSIPTTVNSSNRKNSNVSGFDFDDEMNDEEKALESLCIAWMEEFGAIKFPSLIGNRIIPL